MKIRDNGLQLQMSSRDPISHPSNHQKHLGEKSRTRWRSCDGRECNIPEGSIHRDHGSRSSFCKTMSIKWIRIEGHGRCLLSLSISDDRKFNVN